MNPLSASVQVGQSADFVLTTSGGDPDQPETWTCASPDVGVVSVELTTIGCRATGLAEGSATISAVVAKGADRATAAAELVVGEVPGAVRITGIEPVVLIEGEPAAIHGTGFSTVASENRVTIGGLDALVSSATATRLTLTVPRAECLPPRHGLLLVSNASATASMSVGITPPREDVDLPVGEYRYTTAGNGCLHLPGSAAGGEYLIGVASTSEVPSSLTPVSLAGTPGDASVVAVPWAAAPRPVLATRTVAAGERIGSSAGGGAPPLSRQLESLAPLQEWSTGRREAEAWLRAREAAELALLARPPAPSPPTGPPARMALGERFTLWADPGGSCTTGTQVEAVVRFVGTHTVWLEDLANPSGTFSDAEFEGLDAFYASRVQPVHDRYFGELSDVGPERAHPRPTHSGGQQGGGPGRRRHADGPVSDDRVRDEQPRRDLLRCRAESGWRRWRGAEPVRPCSPAIATCWCTRSPTWFRANAYVLGGSGEKTIWEIEGGATLAEQLVAYDLFGHGSGRNLGPGPPRSTSRKRAGLGTGAAGSPTWCRSSGGTTSGMEAAGCAARRRSARGSEGRRTATAGRARAGTSTACPPCSSGSSWTAGEKPILAVKRPSCAASRTRPPPDSRRSRR